MWKRECSHHPHLFISLCGTAHLTLILSLSLQFVEGSLVRAMREGCWLLLDEVNLATAETLERLSGMGFLLRVLQMGGGH